MKVHIWSIIGFVIAATAAIIYLYSGIGEKLFISDVKSPTKELVKQPEPVDTSIDFETYQPETYKWR